MILIPPGQESVPPDEEGSEGLEAEKRLSVPKWFERMTPWEKQEMEHLVIPQEEEQVIRNRLQLPFLHRTEEEEDENDVGRFLERPVPRPTYVEGGRIFVPPVS